MGYGLMPHGDGGPAFPVSDAFVDSHEGGHGMSLRDYFAGHALAGLSANPQFDVDVKTMAGWAWAQADAMLAARNTNEDTDR